MTGKIIARFRLPETDGLAEHGRGSSKDEEIDLEYLQASLFSLGAEGSWERQVQSGDSADFDANALLTVGVDAYFRDEQWSAELFASLGTLAAQVGVEFEGGELLIDQDWMEAHRQLAKPLKVGRFIIDPREPDDLLAQSQLAQSQARDAKPVEQGEFTIRVPARRAFGTGSHETTRLVLRLMQGLTARSSEVDQVDSGTLRGQRVLDVGSGTGVLSFAAAHLEAELVVGYDIDVVSAVMASSNRRLNGFTDRSPLFFAGTESAVRAAEGTAALFDLALVNVLPEKLEGVEKDIAALVDPCGALLVSGLLSGASPSHQALERWRACGWREMERLEEGEWMAVVLGRES